MGELLSVVTPVYNGERMISRCYWSLCKQTWTDWEWVVVDDGSTDGTLDVLQRISDADPRVRVVTYRPNRGRGYARTASLREARADWTVLWDADDLYMPDRLARIDAARAAGWDYYTSPAVVMNLDLEYLGVRGRGRALKPLNTPILIHAATAARTDLFREIGYDPELRTVGQIGEDAAVVFRLSVCHRGYFDPEPTMINIIGNEVFLKKSVHSNGIQLREIRRMQQDGVMPLGYFGYHRLLLRKHYRLNMLRILVFAPWLYPIITGRRRRGSTGSDVSLPRATAEFLEEVRNVFGRTPIKAMQYAAPSGPPT